jgi:hypothetical protein
MTRGESEHPLIPLVLILLLLGGASAASVSAQATGEYRCSVPNGGSQDGTPCQTHADCPGGACVFGEGVCDDQEGRQCLCPEGTCSGDTCSGGPLAGQTCDTSYNCDPGVLCRGSQKVCVGGSNSGYPCLNGKQCDSGQCVSTGRVCIGYCDDQNQLPCPCPGGTCTPPGSCSGGILDGFSCSATMNCSSGTECVGTYYSPDSCGQDVDCCQDTTCPVGVCLSPGSTPTPIASRTASRETPTSGIVTPQPTVPPGGTPPRGLLLQAVGEGAGCATVADKSACSLAILAVALALWMARHRSGGR